MIMGKGLLGDWDMEWGGNGGGGARLIDRRDMRMPTRQCHGACHARQSGCPPDAEAWMPGCDKLWRR